MRFTGRTEDSGSLILGGEFWKPGVKISGLFIRKWKSKNGDCFEFRLAVPIKVYVDADTESRILPKDSKEPGREVAVEKVSVGALKGFVMACDDLKSKGAGEFQYKDNVIIECTGTVPSEDKDKQDMLKFAVDLNRV